jgi:hypothetical protein
VTGPASTLQRSIVGVTMNAKKRMRGSSVLIDKSFLVTQPKKGEIIITGVKSVHLKPASTSKGVT